jgi:hypothetical protein
LNATYVIAGTAALAVGTATIVLRRLREATRLRQLSARLGWPLRLGRNDSIDARAHDLSLMKVGHSRRIGALFEASRDIRLFSYTYESGTEFDRSTHTWRVAICPIAVRARWALLSNEPWLLAAGAAQRLEPVDLQPFLETGAVISPHAFVADDATFWQARLTPKLAAFLTQQSRERSWEIVPGLVAAFEPGACTAEEMAAIADQMNRFVQLLSDALGDDVGEPTPSAAAVSSAG